MVTKEQAAVFLAGGRRFFTKRAAVMKEARDTYFAKHPCECEEDVGAYCSNHMHDERTRGIVERLARRIMRRDFRNG